MTDVQEVFNNISLERNMKMWQSEEDNKVMTRKRLQFLAEFPETNFSALLNVGSSPGRKNLVLSGALVAKARKTSRPPDRLKLWNQALCYCPPEEKDLYNDIVRGRAVTLFDLEEYVSCVDDVMDLEFKGEDDFALVIKCGVKMKVCLLYTSPSPRDS